MVAKMRRELFRQQWGLRRRVEIFAHGHQLFDDPGNEAMATATPISTTLSVGSTYRKEWWWRR